MQPQGCLVCCHGVYAPGAAVQAADGPESMAAGIRPWHTHACGDVGRVSGGATDSYARCADAQAHEGAEPRRHCDTEHADHLFALVAGCHPAPSEPAATAMVIAPCSQRTPAPTSQRNAAAAPPIMPPSLVVVATYSMCHRVGPSSSAFCTASPHCDGRRAPCGNPVRPWPGPRACRCR